MDFTQNQANLLFETLSKVMVAVGVTNTTKVSGPDLILAANSFIENNKDKILEREQRTADEFRKLTEQPRTNNT